MRIASCTAIALVLVACSSGPQIRSDFDRSADFQAYRTYAFASELGTDRAGYSTLITEHFKRSVSRQMEARGYRQSAERPDLLVNFFTTARERTEVRSVPRMETVTGYYNYRLGLYSAWPLYSRDVQTTTYRVGTASIDIVDAARNQLVWEGVAEGRITSKMLEDPAPAIDDAVAEIFEEFPVDP